MGLPANMVEIMACGTHYCEDEHDHEHDHNHHGEYEDIAPMWWPGDPGHGIICLHGNVVGQCSILDFCGGMHSWVQVILGGQPTMTRGCTGHSCRG